MTQDNVAFTRPVVTPEARAAAVRSLAVRLADLRARVCGLRDGVRRVARGRRGGGRVLLHRRHRALPARPCTCGRARRARAGDHVLRRHASGPARRSRAGRGRRRPRPPPRCRTTTARQAATGGRRRRRHGGAALRRCAGRGRRAGRRRAHPALAGGRGRRARDRDLGRRPPRGQRLPGAPASASTRPRTCPSARAAWSPPTIPSWPTASARAGCTACAAMPGVATPGRLVALRRGGGRHQGQPDRRGRPPSGGCSCVTSTSGRTAVPPSPGPTSARWPRSPDSSCPTSRRTGGTPGTSTSSGSPTGGDEPRRAVQPARDPRHRHVGALHPAAPPDLHADARPSGRCRCPARTWPSPSSCPSPCTPHSPTTRWTSSARPWHECCRRPDPGGPRMTLVNGSRPVATDLWPSHLPPTRHTLMRTLIVGAGEAGRALARDLAATPAFGLHPIGFLDDDPELRLPQSLPVLGTLADLTAVARRMADRRRRPRHPAPRPRGLPSGREQCCRRGRQRSVPAVVRGRPRAHRGGDRHAVAGRGRAAGP